MITIIAMTAHFTGIEGWHILCLFVGLAIVVSALLTRIMPTITFIRSAKDGVQLTVQPSSKPTVHINDNNAQNQPPIPKLTLRAPSATPFARRHVAPVDSASGSQSIL